MLRNKFLATRLNDAENFALTLWAKSEGLDKSTMARRVLRLALRDMAPRSIFPVQILDALNLSQEIKTQT